MGNRAYALITGVFVLGLSIALIAAAIWLKGPTLATKPYVVVAQRSVYGLVPESRVFFRGVAAGEVKSINFDPENSLNILIRINVNEDTPITRSTVAELKLQGVTGLSQLELENSLPNSPPLPTDMASPARIPMQPSVLDALGTNGADVLTQLDRVMKSLNEILTDKDRGHIKALLAQADAATAELVVLERNFNQAAAHLPQLTQQTNATLVQIDGLVRNLNQLTVNFNGLSRIGQSAGNDLTRETLPRLNRTLDQITRASADIRRLSMDLDRDPQRLLLGPQKPSPGPGEPGYKEPPK